MDEWQGMQILPFSLNKFIYTEADPVNAIDPSGNYSLAQTGTANNISRTLAATSTPRVTVGFSFTRNKAGVIAGVATATACATGLAADQFKIVENIAAFSKKCDGSNHRGRWQAQGGGIDEGVGWSQGHPLTLSEGLRKLEELYSKLKPKDRKARADSFEQARRFAVTISVAGGVTVEGLKFERNFPPGRTIRVDLEVRKGRAFVPD